MEPAQPWTRRQNSRGERRQAWPESVSVGYRHDRGLGQDPVVRVSVVTPCLNPGERLVRCLDSVSRQTYADVEHVVVDGGSTDGTVELARSRGLLVVSEPDRGQTDALNKGFALATGGYVGWLNADDWLVAEAIERIVDTFAANPRVGWVYCDCEIRQEGGNREVARPPDRLNKETLEFGNQ